MKREREIRDSPMPATESTIWSWPLDPTSSLTDLAVATGSHVLNLGSECGKHGGEVGDAGR